MNAMELRCSRMSGGELSEAIYANHERFKQQREARENARCGRERETAFMALMETERERAVIASTLRARGMHVPPFENNCHGEQAGLRRITFRPGLSPTGKKLPIVGYRQLREGRSRLTVTAVVTTEEDGVWRSDIMLLAKDTAARIQAELTGENTMDVLNRMYREQKEKEAKTAG